MILRVDYKGELPPGGSRSTEKTGGLTFLTVRAYRVNPLTHLSRNANVNSHGLHIGLAIAPGWRRGIAGPVILAMMRYWRSVWIG